MARNKTQLIKEMMENYPEANGGNPLRCLNWNYEKMEFEFLDEEEDKTYQVNMNMLKVGLNKLLVDIADGKYFNCGQPPNLLSEGYDYDSQDCDALVQCAIFGEVIYG